MTIIQLLAAGVATVAVAVPAAAQQPYAYPQQTYPQYQYPPGYVQPGYAQPGYAQPGYAQPGYGYPGPQGYGQGQDVIGQIVNQLLGNRYNVSDRTAVTRCASAAVRQASAQYRGHEQGYAPGYGGQGYPPGYGGQGYPPGYGQQGYNQRYNPQSIMRVTAITDVRRNSRGLRVSGQMSSGMYGGYGAYAAPGYGTQGYGAPGYGRPAYQGYGDLNFRCSVAYSGQVTDVRIGRNSGYRRR